MVQFEKDYLKKEIWENFGKIVDNITETFEILALGDSSPYEETKNSFLVKRRTFEISESVLKISNLSTKYNFLDVEIKGENKKENNVCCIRKIGENLKKN